MYIIIIQHLYTLRNDHRKSSYPLLPSAVNIIDYTVQVVFIKCAACQVLSQGPSPVILARAQGVGFGISILQVSPMRSCDIVIYSKKIYIFDLPPGV